jgi:hypothetical protein
VFGFFLDRLSLKQNARCGQALAAGSALGWSYIVTQIFIPNAPAIRGSSVTMGAGSNVLATIAGIFIVLDGFYGRSLATRDLESRVDVVTGPGKKWRWGLVVQFWGVWVYWLVASFRLPPRGAYLAAQQSAALFGPLRRSRQQKRDRSRQTPS